MKRVDALAAIALGATGAVPAAYSLTPIHSIPVEFAVWTALAAALWIPVVRARRSPPFLTLLAAGIVAGVVVAVVQALGAQLLLDNSEDLRAQLGAVATPAVRGFFAASALGVGLVWGAFIGLVAWGFAKWRPAAASA